MADAAAKKPVAVKLDTAKLWRLIAQSQAIRQQVNESELGKALATAEADAMAEQKRLAGLCGIGWSLGNDQDPNSPTFKDIICVQATPPPPPPDAAKKEK